MSKRPKITITLVEKRANGHCHYGHKIGDQFDFDTERGKLCPMAMHVAFPYMDILRYGGQVPGNHEANVCYFCCPDPDIINVFQVKKEENQ